MIFPTDTILERKRPLGKNHNLYPFNKVRVVGRSPIKAPSFSEWEGADGETLLVEPLTAFATHQSMPVSIADRDYTVTYDPPAPEGALGINSPDAGPRLLTAEEQFAREAS